MKKSLFFAAAASALMLTACSSENDVVQNAPQTKEATAQAVGFDVYTPAATEVTRAGQAGTMTTGRLQRTALNGGGFGVYAYLVEDVNATAGDDNASSYLSYGTGPASARTTPFAPNYMVNEKITWNNTNLGWEYSPLKYWPNETDKDSQNTNAEMEGITGDKHLDRLTFFAYAPYVTAGANAVGVTQLTNKAGYLDANPTTETTTEAHGLVEASVGYKASLDDPNTSVDLLWGVAPAGGLSYTAVNGRTVTVPEGQPLMDMTKPDVNTSMKFLFQHALARIGINVVAAVDQVGAGGKLDENTRITVNSVTLTGKFGETGILNLDNPTANVAHWVDINGTPITNTTAALPTDKTLELAVGKIAPSLRYAGSHTFGSYSAQPTGVTTTKQDLMAGRYYALDAVPAYSPAKQYFSDDAGTVAIAKYNVQTSDSYYTYATNTYTQTTGIINAPATGNVTNYYKIVAGETEYDGTHVLAYYSDEECTTYNATLDGAWTTSTVKTPATPATYYEATDDEVIAGTKNVGDEKTPAVPAEYYSPDECKTHNLGLTGARTTSTVKTYGYNDTDLPTSTVLYARTGDAGSYVYTYAGTKGEITWDGTAATYCTITPTLLAATDINFAYTETTIYDVERNYFMVVPTNNVKQLNDGLDPKIEKALRTIRVKIEYYVTTTDNKVSGGRTQTKNVIEKDVVFPSIANGKSYMLNLVLGLTSVKMEAEVDDWKVINVQGDLPQNTAE